MNANLMPISTNALNERRMLIGHAAKYKESGLHAMLAQNVQQRFCGDYDAALEMLRSAERASS